MVPPSDPLAGAKRVLVTGGAGFLGSHLVERLLAEGNSVVCIDNLQTGSAANVALFQANKRFAFLRHDVTEPYSCDVDQAYNLACAASPPLYQKDAIHTFKTSVFGIINAVEAAGKARVLQASTSEVYGDPRVHPQVEGYWGNVNPVGIRSCYDEGKRGAETLLSDFSRQRGADVRIARIFNTYGPRMQPDDGRVVSNFIIQALTGDDLTIYGDGTQTRSFCYVDDMIDGLMKLMQSDTVSADPVNIGNPVEFTMLQLAEIVIEMTGSRSRILHKALPSDDPTQRRPDISRAKSSLNWSPKTPLAEGLRKTIAYFDTLLSSQPRTKGSNL